jgi:hypothetical protein
VRHDCGLLGVVVGKRDAFFMKCRRGVDDVFAVALLKFGVSGRCMLAWAGGWAVMVRVMVMVNCVLCEESEGEVGEGCDGEDMEMGGRSRLLEGKGCEEITRVMYS